LFTELGDELRENIRERAEARLRATFARAKDADRHKARVLPPPPLVGRENEDFDQREIAAIESASLEIKRDLVRAILKRIDPDQLKAIEKREKPAMDRFKNAKTGAVRQQAKLQGLQIRRAWLEHLPDLVERLQGSDPMAARKALREGYLTTAHHRSRFIVHEAYHPEIGLPLVARKLFRTDIKGALDSEYMYGPDVRGVIEADDDVPIAKTVKANSPYVLELSSYKTHSLGPYSLDCTIGAKAGEDGYYDPEVVKAVLRHVAKVSGNWDWWVLYTDSRVAEIINEELSVRRVSFQWEHGPKPYKLHLHFDVHPLASVVPQPYTPAERQQSSEDETESRVPYGYKRRPIRKKKPPKPKPPP